jgi:ABC-type glutathione transport system ATPase component
VILDIRGLNLHLGDREVPSGVDLRLSPGEVPALIGSNGAGKSTLAYALMGSEGYRPQRGEILFRGQSVLDVAMHERVRLGPRARYLADFSLVQGRVGRLDIDYEFDDGAEAVTELTGKKLRHCSGDAWLSG